MYVFVTRSLGCVVICLLQVASPRSRLRGFQRISVDLHLRFVHDKVSVTCSLGCAVVASLRSRLRGFQRISLDFHLGLVHDKVSVACSLGCAYICLLQVASPSSQYQVVSPISRLRGFQRISLNFHLGLVYDKVSVKRSLGCVVICLLMVSLLFVCLEMNFICCRVTDRKRYNYNTRNMRSSCAHRARYTTIEICL